MVKAQVKEGLSMQSDSYSWGSPAAGPIKPSQPYSPSPTPSTLKRHRSPSSATMGSPAPPTQVPPIPKLQGDILLEVFTHRSLRFPDQPRHVDSEHGDYERLAALGDKVLETAVTVALFRKRPMIKGTDIEKQRKEFLLPSNICKWVTAYGLRNKMVCSSEAVKDLDNPEELVLIFQCYVGAVHATLGMTVVQNWIGALVDPDYIPSYEADMDMDPMHSAKKLKTEPQQQPLYNPVYSSTPEPPMAPPLQPPPPAGPPPPLPSIPSAPLPNPLAPAQPHTAFLPLFNQTANQRRMFVEYPATFSGPAHAGKWTVKCVVNGIEQGTGSGASKQLAKEEAARQAYFAMGWAPRS